MISRVTAGLIASLLAACETWSGGSARRSASIQRAADRPLIAFSWVAAFTGHRTA